ncbi:putative Major facilitator superfamily domain-containing protein [Seiridium cardinale]
MSTQRLARFYRSCLFQIIIVGLVSLCEPGIWTALNNLGAGGQASPFLNNAANALTYGLMSVGCTIAGGVSNKITPKWTLVLGAAFYTPYAAGLYCNNRYGNEWFMLLGAGLCGIGASLLWASEAAIAVGYPEEAKRGRYIAIWMGIRQLGPLIGGSISLAINVNTRSTGKVSYNTYLGLIAISALGAPFALLLSQPQKVVRSDGTNISYMRQTSLAVESRAIWRQLKSPYLLLLVPVFLAGQFGVTYQSNYLTTYFTVRSRALASFLTAVLGLGANLTTGLLLDMPRVSQAAKSRAVYIGVSVVITACWIWNAIVQVKLTGEPSTTFDLGSGSFAGSAFAVYMFFRFFYEALQTYLYWLMGTVGQGTGKEGHRHGDIARTTGILRSWESVGSTIAYVVGATHWLNLNQMILGFVLWFVTIPPTLVALYGHWEPEKGVIEERTSPDSSSVEEQRAPVAVKV